MFSALGIFQLVAPYLPFVETDMHSTTAEKQYQDTSVLHAVRLLSDVLKAQDPFLSPDPFPLAPSPPTSDARAPSHDDRAIFTTNLTPFKVQAGGLSFGGKASTSQSGRRSGSGRADVAGFDPSTSVGSLDEYLLAWHDHAAALHAEDSTTVFPSTKDEFKFSLSWYAAVNGRHPTASSTLANATCWSSPSSPIKGDYFGLDFLRPQDLSEMTVVGSRLLGNLVGAGEEDLTAESWEVWSRPDSLVGAESSSTEEVEWIRRRLAGPVVSTKLGEGPFWRHTFQLAPLAIGDAIGGTLGAEFGEEDGAGDDADAGVFKVKPRQKRAAGLGSTSADGTQKVGGIKFISRDRKSQRIRVCGWQIGEWVL